MLVSKAGAANELVAKLLDRYHVRQADLDVIDLPAPRWPKADGTYPDGPGPAVRDTAQLLQLIALDRTFLVAPESARSRSVELAAFVSRATSL